uniref:Uncharacterized protein n=1 Tax=Globisporangium ultimum (strain ATCC 200006 / CBS 805.95 / DAOM BR144) TaxID=431595 RepID=K3X698_GLOUD
MSSSALPSHQLPQGASLHLPLVNAGLFLLQLVFTWIGFAQGDSAQLKYDTLITPAPYAFSIWGLIYVLTFVALGVDIFHPSLSFFTNSAKPDVFRVLFALSCITNAGWCLLFNNEYVNLATLDITLLWLVLLPIYLFANYERRISAFQWKQFVCSELCFRVYFSWISAATALSWAITFQQIAGGYLSIGSYLALLGTLLVFVLTGVVYGEDPVIGVVGAWTLIALADKNADAFQGVDREKVIRIQAAASLAAGVVLAMVIVSAVYRVVLIRLNRAAKLVATTPKRGYRSYGAVKTTSGSSP